MKPPASKNNGHHVKDVTELLIPKPVVFVPPAHPEPPLEEDFLWDDFEDFETGFAFRKIKGTHVRDTGNPEREKNEG